MHIFESVLSVALPVSAEMILTRVTLAGTFTVFAPTNDAFGTLFETVDPNSLTEEQVRTVLLTHVLGDVVKAENLVDEAVVPTLNDGESLTVDLDGGAFVKAGGNDANVAIAITDLHTSNGVVHVVSDCSLVICNMCKLF